MAHLPPAVQKTIRQQKGDGKLNSIDKNTEDGEVTYDVEVTRDGKARSFTVGGDGELLDEEVFLSELSPAVQQTIQKQIGSGTLGEIEKTFEDREPSYDVEVTLGGKTRNFTVDAKGGLLEVEALISELPAPLQAAIRKETGGDKIEEIKKCFDGDEISYDVEVTGNGRSRTLSFDPDGQLWYKEEEVKLSDTPEAVQKQIKAFAGGGKVLGVRKIVEDDEISYDAEVQDGEREKAVSVSPDGKVIPDAEG